MIVIILAKRGTALYTRMLLNYSVCIVEQEGHTHKRTQPKNKSPNHLKSESKILSSMSYAYPYSSGKNALLLFLELVKHRISVVLSREQEMQNNEVSSHSDFFRTDLNV